MSWIYKELNQVCDILDKRRKPITKKDRVPGPYPYYGASGVLDYVDDFIFDEELVLLGEDGAKWGAGENSAFSISGKTWVNNHAHVLRPDRDKILDSWLIYYLNGSDLNPFISGMTVPKLNQGRLKEIEIPIPPVEEQKRIVAILDEAFADIDKARALTERNLENARQLFESYLSQVFGRAEMNVEKVSLGKASGGVQTGPFGSLLHKSDYIDGGIPLINPAHITSIGIEPDNKKTVSLETKERLKSYIVSQGDIVIGRRGEMGRCATVTENEDGFLCGTGSFFIKSSEHIFSPYLVRFLRSNIGKNKLEKLAGGAVMPNLSNAQLSKLEIPLPSFNVQRKIADEIDILSDNLEKVSKIYCRKSVKLEELKKALLQKAFTGELTKAA